MAVSDSLFALVETSATYEPLAEGLERVVTDEYVVWIGGVDHPVYSVAQRFRLEPERVAPAVDEIRALFRARGRSVATYELGPSSRPLDLEHRLRALGLRTYDDDPVTAGMVLTAAPLGDRAEATARRVQSLDEYLTAIDITTRVFGLNDDQRADKRVGAAERFADEQAGAPFATFLAFVDGEAIASAKMMLTDRGAILSSGATLPHARGRGAYRALVAARWEEAQRRGLGALVVQAGPMSRPILERLGFVQVCEVRVLLDEFG